MTSSDLRTRLGRRARRLAGRLSAVRRGAVSLTRPEPVSTLFGYDRGTPVDRVYIERFLGERRALVHGRVLEIGDDRYTRQFGSGIVGGDVLHAEPGNPAATLVGDLADPATLGDRRFDCILLVQTLQFIGDPAAALAVCRAALDDGGTLLATVPAISQISRHDMDRWGDYWRFTGAGAQRLFGAAFGADAVEVVEYGNAAVACAFLQGLAAEELEPAVLDARHPDYPLVIGVQARR